MARGDGEREAAWPEEGSPLPVWCGTVRGSRSKAVAGSEMEHKTGGEGIEEGEEGDGSEEEERAEGEDLRNKGGSDSTVMAGHEVTETVGEPSTGVALDTGAEPEPPGEQEASSP